jgi:competence transcription factor ComK
MVRSKSNHFRVQEMKERGCRRSGCFYAGGKKRNYKVFCLGFVWGLLVGEL